MGSSSKTGYKVAVLGTSTQKQKGVGGRKKVLNMDAENTWMWSLK